MNPSHPRRRDFVRTVALGATAGLVSTSTRRVQGEEPQQAPNVEAGEDPFELEVDARMGLILARYGDRLDEEARLTIRVEVAGIVRRGQRLREFPLNNGDGPACIWIPYRGPIA